MRTRNKIALCIFALFYVSFGVFLTLNQERIVYYPNTQDFETCADFASAQKVTHNGTRMYVANTDKPTIVLYHGNAGSACDRAFYAHLFSAAGYGYIIVEYAGYSADTQIPSHDAIKENVQAIVDYIQTNNITHISVVGESIGTGIAAYHTSLLPPEKLLLISPFTDLKDVAKSRFWFYPTSLLVNNAFDSITNLASFKNPVTIIHGEADTIIPHTLGRKLFDSLATEKEFVSIPMAGHNDLFLFDETFTAISDFLAPAK